MSLPKYAWTYIYTILALAVAATFYTALYPTQQAASLALWLTLASTATVMRLFVMEGPQHRSYEASTIALFASIFLLAEWQFVLVVLCSFSIEWGKQRWTNSSMLRYWYVQPFNMAKTMLGGFVVYALFDLNRPQLTAHLEQAAIGQALLAIVLYVMVNQLLLALWLLIVRRVTMQQTGLLYDSWLIEIPLAGMGYIAVILLSLNVWLPFLMLAPVVLIYQSFMLPKIQADAMNRLENINSKLVAANAEIHQLNDELFLTLAKIFDARDPYVGSHAAQVAAYAVAIATEMKLPTAQVEIVRQSAYLHDIGKIAIPEAILHKPDQLTESEYEFVKRHAAIGADFIATSHGLRHLAPYIRHHHERWDGRGYPDGLVGETIPLEARILNVCDSVEAMASDRPYHKALSTEEIIKEVIRCAGAQFDPIVAKAFIRIAEREDRQLVVNSARSVVEQERYQLSDTDGLKLKRFAQIYGLASA
jgi:putative nucleotidyltransferase with HDIG domain